MCDDEYKILFNFRTERLSALSTLEDITIRIESDGKRNSLVRDWSAMLSIVERGSPKQ